MIRSLEGVNETESEGNTKTSTAFAFSIYYVQETITSSSDFRGIRIEFDERAGTCGVHRITRGQCLGDGERERGATGVMFKRGETGSCIWQIFFFWSCVFDKLKLRFASDGSYRPRGLPRHLCLLLLYIYILIKKYIESVGDVHYRRRR